jgi:hypothetical protein
MTCRNSRAAVILFWLILLAMLVALPGAFAFYAQASWWFRGPLLVFALLMFRWAVRDVWKALRRSNWVMHLGPDGIWLNLRSFRNCNFEPARTVLYVPYDEVAGAGRHTFKHTERQSDGQVTWKETSLDIELFQPAGTMYSWSAEVDEAIAAERLRRHETRHLFGLVTSRSRANHVPVLVAAPGVLRVAWRGRQTCVRPSLKKVLDELGRRVGLREETARDYSGRESLSDEEIDHLVLELAQLGDTLGAVKALTKHRSYSTTRAKQFVDELTAKL